VIDNARYAVCIAKDDRFVDRVENREQAMARCDRDAVLFLLTAVMRTKLASEQSCDRTGQKEDADVEGSGDKRGGRAR
jgi:hypothetical protein